MFSRWKGDPDHHAEGVVPPPADPNAPGAGGKPYKVKSNLTIVMDLCRFLFTFSEVWITSFVKS